MDRPTAHALDMSSIDAAALRSVNSGHADFLLATTCGTFALANHVVPRECQAALRIISGYGVPGQTGLNPRAP